MNNVDVTVTVTVNIGGQPHTRTASALTDADPHRVADGLLQGLRGDVGRWLQDERFARGGN